MSAPSSEKAIPSPVAPVPQQPITVVQVSELDSYVRERQKEQPRTLDEVVQVSDRRRKDTAHQLELPEPFQSLSYDHESDGRFVFKWIFKHKRAIDDALVKGWVIVNQAFFANVPAYHFGPSGGIEIGDNLLMFMPSKKALELRARPGKISRERMQARMSIVDKKKVLMTGNPNDPNVYTPKLSVEESDEAAESVGMTPDSKDF